MACLILAACDLNNTKDIGYNRCLIFFFRICGAGGNLIWSCYSCCNPGGQEAREQGKIDCCKSRPTFVLCILKAYLHLAFLHMCKASVKIEDSMVHLIQSSL